MHAMLIVIGAESIERPCQVVDIPEEYVVQILPLDCLDQPFDERMRAREQGQGLDVVDFEHAQGGPPVVTGDQRISVGGPMRRRSCPAMARMTILQTETPSLVAAAALNPMRRRVHTSITQWLLRRIDSHRK